MIAGGMVAGVGMVWEIVVREIVVCFAREIGVVVEIVVAVIICSSMIFKIKDLALTVSACLSSNISKLVKIK